MSFLKQIKSGKIQKKIFMGLIGTAGVGKTTFACDFPKPLMLDLESGSSFLNVPRLPRPESFQEVLAVLKEVSDSSHEYESLIIDTIDFLEMMANEEVCKENQIKSVAELGFGKGFELAHQKMISFLEIIKKINQKMNVILIAHSTIKRINDPLKQTDYERHELKLRDKNSALFKEAVDALLFCTMEVSLIENKQGKTKAVGEGLRVMLTQGRPSHEGKNRYSLPYKLPLSYEAFKKALDQGTIDSPENLTKLIEEAIPDIKDAEIKAKVEAALVKSKDNPEQLAKILNRVQTILAA